MINLPPRLRTKRVRLALLAAPALLSIAGASAAVLGLFDGSSSAGTSTGVTVVDGASGTLTSSVGSLLPALAQTGGPDHCAITRTGEYPRSDPAAVGLDPQKLADALAYASANGSFTIKVFRHGCLVGEGLRDAAFERAPANNWGNTKTVVALLTGIAQDRGFVDIDAPIGTYLPNNLGDAAHRAVTLRQLLWASSGAEVNQVRGLNFFGDVSRVRDWFAQPITRAPGTYYFYDQTATSVIVYVIERALAAKGQPMDYQDFAQSFLFDNLGIPKSAYFWQRDRSGTTSGYSQLFLRPLEFGRFGELIRGNGVFQGKQVVSAAYMREFATQAPTNCGYTFLAFSNACRSGQRRVNVGVPTRVEVDGRPWVASAPANMIFTDGVGTRIWVIPELDMVITRSGEQEFDAAPSASSLDVDNVVPGRPGARGTHDFFRLLMAAVTDMPAAVRATIANSGPYAQPPEVTGVDLLQFINQPSAPIESYSGFLLPGQCDPLGCADEDNDGIARLVLDAPRVVPGTVGLEQRPDGGA
ncbi:serine hydrolase [Sphingomonas sp. RHCKR47]|uniref:serine hydrolase domain-containing protein n=1 Tax=Sphingomonas citricola TaxID=2862498 RepID=UPI001CA4F680|nr:serine hydrolase [Sphingomonas citricola]MBW6522672.1 serine hydrolase [Sphingomonas citricola]